MEEEKIAGMPEAVSEATELTEGLADVGAEKAKIKRTTAPQLTEEEMYQIIRDFKASGQTRREFCKDRDYPMSNFYYWQKKFNQKFPEEMTEKSDRTGKAKKEKVKKEKVVKAATTRKSSAKAPRVKATGTKAKERVKKDTAVAVDVEAALADPLAVTEEVPAKRRGRPRKTVEAVVTEKKPRGKAAKAAKGIKVPKVAEPALPAVEVPVVEKARKAPKRTAAKPVVDEQQTTLYKGVYMQIRYPNGIRINVPADIDMQRLKELFQL